MGIFEVFQEIWAVRALIASSLVGIMCGALGAFIVLRNMSLIGDALSHAILPGVVVAFIVLGYSALGFFGGAVIAGLLAAIAITWIQQNVNTKNDAAIGIVFTAMFSLGVMGISYISRNEGVHLDLKDFLFGNVLGVSDQDLLLTASITVFVVVSIAVLYRYLLVSTFQSVIAETMGISVRMIHYFLMLLLSFAVVASLQTVGVILVVAMLITPASTALLLSNKLQTVVFLSALLGLLSAVIGLLGAIYFETTPGPAMAVAATLFYLIAAFFAPGKGVLSKYLARRSQQRKIEIEDLLKHAYKQRKTRGLTVDKLKESLDRSSRRLNRQIRYLKERGLLAEANGMVELTKEGLTRARDLVRAHRLWETYLANQVGLSSEQIHEDAERFEHLLTEEILDEVDRELGFPKEDPHGSVIPQKFGAIDFPLLKLASSQKARISPRQISAEISAALWRLGLEAGEVISLVRKTDQSAYIISDQQEMPVDIDLARRINVEPMD